MCYTDEGWLINVAVEMFLPSCAVCICLRQYGLQSCTGDILTIVMYHCMLYIDLAEIKCLECNGYVIRIKCSSDQKEQLKSDILSCVCLL